MFYINVGKMWDREGQIYELVTPDEDMGLENRNFNIPCDQYKLFSFCTDCLNYLWTLNNI